MRQRYLLAVAEESRRRIELVERLARSSGLELAFSNQRMAALAHSSCGYLAIGEAGCILGSLFHRNGPARRVPALAGSEAASIIKSDGQALLGHFWGAYAAAIAGPNSVRILRDPCGDFPCYYAAIDGVTVFASDAELLVNGGVAGASIDLEEIGRQLFRAFVPVPSTALSGIHELLAGFALRIPSDGGQEPCWSPWGHVDVGRTDSDAAERLSRIVQHTVQARASGYHSTLLSVSGGLDSSIVAACLAKAGAETICLTMFTDDPAGDERPFARALCDRLGLRLIERQYRLEDIDIGEPMATNLPRPKDRTQALAFERVHYAVAAELGADAFMTGNGGDHVFGYSQSAAPIADRYLAEGLGQGTWAALLDVCRQTGCSIADAARQAWRLARAAPGYHVRPNPLFLHRDFVGNLGPKDLHHPYLDAPAGALPGKAAHIATILRVQPNLEPSLGDRYPVINPLISQPIVEACLQVPTWEWRGGGRDRSLARRAFANNLPPLILDRRVKGTPGRFAARLLDHFRPAIRDRLLGGRLAAHGIVDAIALERVLAGERPVPDLERVRILELVNAEAWIDHWTARGQAPEPRHPDIKSGAHDPPPASGGPIP
ncbi:MAG TPA: asparagine synthase-related protein [Sphingomicrobium sp.]|nr:asparagine synthase-related protein [Sphingomicrobium sp.]